MYYEDANQAQIEAERDKQRKDARNDREYLEETLHEANRESCYADYSGGKTATTACDYSTNTPVATKTSDGIVVGVSMGVIFAVALLVCLVKHK